MSLGLEVDPSAQLGRSEGREEFLECVTRTQWRLSQVSQARRWFHRIRGAREMHRQLDANTSSEGTYASLQVIEVRP